MLSLKVVFFLGLDIAKHVSDIHALSVHPACVYFTSGNLRVNLRSNPAFILKVVSPCLPVDLAALQPFPLGNVLQGSNDCICCVQFVLCIGMWKRGVSGLCPELSSAKAKPNKKSCDTGLLQFRPAGSGFI